MRERRTRRTGKGELRNGHTAHQEKESKHSNKKGEDHLVVLRVLLQRLRDQVEQGPSPSSNFLLCLLFLHVSLFLVHNTRALTSSFVLHFLVYYGILTCFYVQGFICMEKYISVRYESIRAYSLLLLLYRHFIRRKYRLGSEFACNFFFSK
jgi:hypothetical protein